MMNTYTITGRNPYDRLTADVAIDHEAETGKLIVGLGFIRDGEYRRRQREEFTLTRAEIDALMNDPQARAELGAQLVGATIVG